MNIRCIVDIIPKVCLIDILFLVLVNFVVLFLLREATVTDVK